MQFLRKPKFKGFSLIIHLSLPLLHCSFPLIGVRLILDLLLDVPIALVLAAALPLFALEAAAAAAVVDVVEGGAAPLVAPRVARLREGHVAELAEVVLDLEVEAPVIGMRTNFSLFQGFQQ